MANRFAENHKKDKKGVDTGRMNFYSDSNFRENRLRNEKYTYFC
jgi:hypothetical protein